MPINVGQAIRRTSADPVDESLVLTKAQMLAVNDELMPDKYFAVCRDDGKFYVYDKNATPDAATGKFFAAYDTNAEFNLQPSTNGMTASWAEGQQVASRELVDKSYVDGQVGTKQNTLVSGQNIKTINGASILGSGNIPIQGGTGGLPSGGTYGQTLVKQSAVDGDAVWGRPQYDAAFAYNSENAVQSKAIKAALDQKAFGYIQTTSIASFETNAGDEYGLPTAANQIVKVELGSGDYLKKLTQEDIDGINAATASSGYVVRINYDETYGTITQYSEPYYDIEIRNNGNGTGSYILNTGNPNPDYQYPNLSGSVYTEVIYKIDKRLIPDSGGSGAIDVIKKNQTALQITNKEVNIEVPTMTYSGTLDEPNSGIVMASHGLTSLDGFAVRKTANGLEIEATAYDETISGDIGFNTVEVAGKNYVDGLIGALTTLTTTDRSSLVGALNEVKFAVDGLGEPFRVKQWASSSLNVEIPVCTEDIGNVSIPKIVYTIDDTEGADYQIVGMLSYELFDAATGGNRINCWPVCQFTGNMQKELSVRWMCGGTTRKTAKRISAWVLLKHR